MADADFPKPRSAAAAVAGLTVPVPESIPGRLRAAVAAVSGRLVFTTSFGIEDQLIAHHMFTERLPIEVVTLDTGRLFPETYAVWQQTEERYGARIRAFHSRCASRCGLVADRGSMASIIQGCAPLLLPRPQGRAAPACARRRVRLGDGTSRRPVRSTGQTRPSPHGTRSAG